MPKRFYPKKAKLVRRREVSFPRRSALFWNTGGELHRATGASGGVELQHGYMLDLKTGEIVSPHARRKEKIAHNEEIRKYYESHGMPEEAAKFVHTKRAKRRRMGWRRKGRPARSRVPLGHPLHRIRTESRIPLNREPKLLAYGTFNVYEIDGKAFIYDHIAKKFRRDPSRDYLITEPKNQSSNPTKFLENKFYLADPQAKVIINKPFPTMAAAEDAIATFIKERAYLVSRKKKPFANYVPIRGDSVESLIMNTSGHTIESELRGYLVSGDLYPDGVFKETWLEALREKNRQMRAGARESGIMEVK